MKIAIVAADLYVGGSQRYLSGLANYWHRQGQEVSVIVLRQGGIYYPLEDGIHKETFDYDHRNLYLRPVLSLTTFRKLRRSLKRIQPDVVLSNLGTTNILTLMASKGLKHKVFIRDAFNHVRKRSKLEMVLRKRLYPRAHGIIAQSKDIKKHLDREFNHPNIQVFGNPVRPLNCGREIKKEKLILNVGALVRRKGQHYLLDLAERLSDDDWTFAVLGEGPAHKALEQDIQRRGLQEKVRLMGAVENVDPWLYKASIFVFPSLMEGLPNALIEAMRSGLPCVSFDCDTGPRELIKNGENGYLVPPNDLEGLLENVERLITDEKLREKIGANARNSTHKFAMEEVSTELLNFFEKSLGASTILKSVKFK